MDSRDEEISIQAADFARKKTLDSLKRHKVTEGLVAKRLYELLNAKEVKVFNFQGALYYSKALVAHGPRSKGIEIASVLLGMKPNEKLDVNHGGSVAIAANLSDEDRELIREGIGTVKEAILEAHRASISKES